MYFSKQSIAIRKKINALSIFDNAKKMLQDSVQLFKSMIEESEKEIEDLKKKMEEEVKNIHLASSHISSNNQTINKLNDLVGIKEAN